jgi:two-component system, cell cycle response regulator CtrA
MVVNSFCLIPKEAAPMRILLIEDDLVAARGISLMLKSSGAVVDHADTGEEGLELSRHYDYDIVVLDLILPDIEGFEVVRRMRISRNDTPVLILSGLTRPQAKVKGLGLGADDFITKPFDRAELLARLQAIIRRSKGFSQPSLRVGPLLLNLDSHDVSVDDQPVHLTGKEYAILELLVLRKGMVLTKEAFLNHLYGGMDEPEMKIIDVFICKLRKKLAVAGADNLIGTVWGRGYMIRDPDVRSSSELSEIPAPIQHLAISPVRIRSQLTATIRSASVGCIGGWPMWAGLGGSGNARQTDRAEGEEPDRPRPLWRRHWPMASGPRCRPPILAS